MRALSLTLALIIIASLVFGQSSVHTGLKLKEGSIDCYDQKSGKKIDFSDCLTFDLLAIGDSQTKVIALMGPIDQVVEQIDTAQVAIYPLTPTHQDDDPYLIVTFKDSVVTTLLLQGRGTTEAFSFSGLTLGDDTTSVVKMLGKPDATVPHKGYDTTVWAYDGLPISIEIENGKIFSIQIWKPSR